ncbi:MAG: DUF3109 family protein [Deltaproteobacteria bacterium]|nr:DUF3109 family protein [Deltaproteobacteria bacterium]
MPGRPKRRDSSRVAGVRAALRELEWTGVRRYVQILREAGDLLATRDADFDLRELVDRRFECDSRKCLIWRGGQMLVDSSCCARYRIELTSLDRERLQAMLPLVRERLPESHALQDERQAPWVCDEDYRMVMAEDDHGVCPFVQYDDGRSTCAVHAVCLDEGLDPWDHKPLACSLWPVATLEYRTDGSTRTLVTAYGRATVGLFADDEDDLDRCVCLVDQSPELPPLYESQRDILQRLFGSSLVRRLDAAARTRSPRPRR